MGLFDEIIGGALKSALGNSDSSSPLGGLLGQLLNQTNLGSIGGLLQQLQQGGLGSEVSSWLSNGHNLPISADQLRAALGNEQVRQMAEKAGIPVDQLLAMLAQHLPQTVDKMSPNGKLEEPPAADEPTGSLADQAGLSDVGR